MTTAVGTSEMTDGLLETEPTPWIPSPPRPARGPRLLRGLARVAAGLSRETVCLLAAVTLTGWTVTNAIAAIATAAILHATLGAGRSSQTSLGSATLSVIVGLTTLMVETWMFAAAPAPPSSAWLTAGLAYAVLTYLLRGVRRAASDLLTQYRAPRKTAILSTGEHGTRLARTLLQHPEYGLEPIGMIGDSAPFDGLELPTLATYSTCVRMLQRSKIGTVVVAGDPPISRTLLQRISQSGCQVLLAPAPDDLIQDFAPLGRHFHSYPLLPMRAAAQGRPYWLVKRVSDATLALLALLFLAPLLGLCLLAARIEGGPGVLFRQQRVGMNGRRFDMLKIRTLKPASAHDSATRWTVSSSRLSGPIGGFLRRTSLDELPQLWNVVIGDMSLVGPRPERPYFVDQFSRQVEHYDRRHRVPVGITGWAQVHGLRGDTSLEERARLDNYYIDAWSMGLDLKIVIRTIGCVLRLGGA